MEITGTDSLPVLASFINVDRHCVCGERLCACVSVCVYCSNCEENRSRSK